MTLCTNTWLFCVVTFSFTARLSLIPSISLARLQTAACKCCAKYCNQAEPKIVFPSVSFVFFPFFPDAGGWNTAKDAYGNFGNNRGKSAFFNDRGNTSRGRWGRPLCLDSPVRTLASTQPSAFPVTAQVRPRRLQRGRRRRGKHPLGGGGQGWWRLVQADTPQWAAWTVRLFKNGLLLTLSVVFYTVWPDLDLEKC